MLFATCSAVLPVRAFMYYATRTGSTALHVFELKYFEKTKQFKYIYRPKK